MSARTPLFSKRSGKRRSRVRGFTLVELLVATVAGLVVAMAVVGLSKIANDTIHEELRSSTAELALRGASDRLRLDLARASYMGTPNGLIDPLIVGAIGAPDRLGLGVYGAGLGQLAGISFRNEGSYADDNKVRTLSDVNNIRPDSIRLGGNFTSGDEYIVQSVRDGGACGGSDITLSLDSPASLRLVGLPDGTMKSAGDALVTLRETFQPVPNASFLVRLVDDSGKMQFGVTCAADPVTYGGGGGPVLHLATPLKTGANVGGIGGVSGLGVGRYTVNPVQIVEWRLARVPSAILDPYDTRYSDGKFDLLRTWVDASGVALVASAQLVAEYASDLQFSFVADTRPVGTPIPTKDDLKILAFSDLGGANTVATLNKYGTATADPNAPGPQRIRSIRFLLATRAALPDREQPLDPVVIAGNDPLAGHYMLRYCVRAAGCAAGDAGYARVRSVTGEVTLLNQSRLF